MYLLNSGDSIFFLPSLLSFRLDMSAPCLMCIVSVLLNYRYIDSAGLSGPLPSSLSELTKMKTL